MTHAERCAIAQQCVPPSAFRAQLTALHDEMLAAVAAERERCAALCEAAKPQGGRMWTNEQAACFDCLAHVAEAIRA